jgi:general secretion pathway protein G
MKKSSFSGFTLIELMIVVAVLAIIAIMAVPKFKDMTTRAKESKARAALGAIRSALDIYYSENQFYPAQLAALEQNSRYMKELPALSIPSLDVNPGHELTGESTVLDDGATGAWFYFTTSTAHSEAYANCTHPDSRGRLWTEY